MEEIQDINQPTAPQSEEVVVDTEIIKENTKDSPKKVKIAQLIFLGLGISIVLIGLFLLVWKIIQNSNKPDLIINAPSVSKALLTPEPTSEEGTLKLVSPEIVFESEPYKNELAGFEINVPKKWSVDDSGKSGAIVVLLDPSTTKSSDGDLLTFISVTSGPSGDTLENEILTAKLGLKKMFSSYQIEEDKQMTLNGNTYHLLSGSYFINDVKMKNRNLILIYNNRGYAISATAPESAWPDKELLLNATIFSFKNF